VVNNEIIEKLCFVRDDINTSSARDRKSKGYENMYHKNVTDRIHGAFQRVVKPKINLATFVAFSVELEKTGLNFKFAVGCCSLKNSFKSM
jgi:hypothetical protein